MENWLKCVALWFTELITLIGFVNNWCLIYPQTLEIKGENTSVLKKQ